MDTRPTVGNPAFRFCSSLFIFHHSRADRSIEAIMKSRPLDLWHNIVRTRDAGGLDVLLDDDVVFHSPVVHTPQIGKAVTTMYLTAAVHVFGNDSFRYVREVVGENDAVLEFETEIDSIVVNGVDMIRWNAEGKIIEFKVMIRPLKAINIIHEKMGEMLRAAGNSPS